MKYYMEWKVRFEGVMRSRKYGMGSTDRRSGAGFSVVGIVEMYNSLHSLSIIGERYGYDLSWGIYWLNIGKALGVTMGCLVASSELLNSARI